MKRTKLAKSMSK